MGTGVQSLAAAFFAAMAATSLAAASHALAFWSARCAATMASPSADSLAAGGGLTTIPSRVARTVR